MLGYSLHSGRHAAQQQALTSIAFMLRLCLPELFAFHPYCSGKIAKRNVHDRTPTQSGFKDNLRCDAGRGNITNCRCSVISAGSAPSLSRAVARRQMRTRGIGGAAHFRREPARLSRRAAAFEELVGNGVLQTVFGRPSPKAKRGNPSGVGGFTYTSPQQ